MNNDEINAGELTRRVTIEQTTGPVANQDDDGHPEEAWTPIEDGTDIPAKIELVAGDERPRGFGPQIEATYTHKVTLRYRSDVTHLMRLVTDDNRILNIARAGDPTGRRRRLVCLCREAP